MSHYGADGRAGTQETFDHLVSVVQRLHQDTLLFGPLTDNKTKSFNLSDVRRQPAVLKLDYMSFI